MKRGRGGILGKIAVEVEDALAARATRGEPGRIAWRLIREGSGWSAADVLCTSAPGDRVFDEEHAGVSIAIVAAGTFQYRSSLGEAVMTPGSLLLGNAGTCFECRHDHAPGDRCISFRYAPEYVERLSAEVGGRGTGRGFRGVRMPPGQASASLVARACAALSGGVEAAWEEIALEIAAAALGYGADAGSAAPRVSPAAVARVTDTVRAIERTPGAGHTLARLAADAGLSPYHFLRVFRQVTGVTPHQFILRTRLREAASRLLVDDAKVIDVAFASGFGDLSNFNLAFRAEFGLTPRSYRARFGRPRAA